VRHVLSQPFALIREQPDVQDTDWRVGPQHLDRQYEVTQQREVVAIGAADDQEVGRQHEIS
jgi:hypothetical protein